jgi:hypothetical protein
MQHKNRSQKTRFKINVTMAFLALAIVGDNCHAADCATAASMTTILRGVSLGGTLTFTPDPEAWNRPYVEITNSPGDSAAVVIARLAKALSECRILPDLAPLPRVGVVNSNALQLFGQRIPGLLGGTDSGLEIPDSPIAVALNYRAESDSFVLEWQNPSVGYDRIWISQGISGDISDIPGNSTSYSFARPQRDYPTPQESVTIVGVKKGTPSNGVVVRLKHLSEQESLMNIPFTRGVAPGFEKWINKPGSSLKLEQGNLPGMVPCTAEKFDGKGFYQVIRGTSNFSGGVCRRFLGLNPGHTYRVSARVNTLQPADGDWSFSAHAAATPTNKTSRVAEKNAGAGFYALSPDAMAGASALPDGSKGPHAGELFSYSVTNNTAGNWVVRSSAENGPANDTHDIKIPVGVNSLIVWFRLAGTSKSEVVVGFDSVTVEDLGKL